MVEKQTVIELRGITKRFGASVIANNNISIDVKEGEILSILGENGCGKTTLMNMLSGIYYPDEGTILIHGQEAVIRSPKDAFRYNIGMIHQHFKLIDVFTAVENIVLGTGKGEKYDLIFLDGPKGQYLKYYPILLKMLKNKGCLIVDNVLFKGLVRETFDVGHKKRAMITKLRKFLQEIETRQDLNVTVHEVGDGIAEIYKKTQS